MARNVLKKRADSCESDTVIRSFAILLLPYDPFHTLIIRQGHTGRQGVFKHPIISKKPPILGVTRIELRQTDNLPASGSPSGVNPSLPWFLYRRSFSDAFLFPALTRRGAVSSQNSVRL